MVVCIEIKACRARFDSQNLQASQKMFVWGVGDAQVYMVYFLRLVNFDLGTFCGPAIFWSRVFGVRNERGRDFLGAYPSVLDVC